MKVLAGASALFMTVLLIGCQQSEEETPGPQRELTEEHGAETAQIIETTRWRFGSLDTQRNPSTLSEILTGPYLDTFEPLFDANDSQPGIPIIISYVDIYGIRVYEYSPEAFTAIGCGTWYGVQVTPTGEPIKPWPSHDSRVLYIFVREDRVWKMALGFGLSNAEDNWRYAQEWEKELIGDLDQYEYAECLDVP